MNKKKLILFLPLVFVFAICLLLLAGLQQDPKKIASALIGKPVPEFHLPNLLSPQQVLNNNHLPKQWHLLNVWGSWCSYCREEHPFLMSLKAEGVQIVGLNYRDKVQGAVEMLQRMGDPFLFSIDDSQGKLALNLGVDGAPETYLVDENGVIRYRYSGAINQKIWTQEFLPEIERLAQ
ncbi:DsbE family thiol:disulfide interchange protein [Conservatibacter flavescens]|uniref:Thiol:disulfide interchange protein n=1 Tax=Conservatibacter flavescens TaxID=28161 RepID=A0A2M8S1W3_9PAST|nr:DsbE family thiol:disulfide interchange protein [Conservatibacter flavescens]PJG85151.1 thiol:disulfide interchange protein [Conservatibacter flavescens]